MDEDKKIVAGRIARECVYYPTQLMFGKLAGTRYKSQYYMANVLYDISFMEVVSRQFFHIVQDTIGHFDFQLTGRQWSSSPLLTSMPVFLKLNHGVDVHSFLIRSSRKTYGRNNFIEGTPNDKPVLIVDDLLNSQNGFVLCRDVLRYEKIPTLPYIFAVLNKYRSRYGDDALNYDRYMGKDFRCLYVVSGDDIDAINKRPR
jgi:hypothetical protein